MMKALQDTEGLEQPQRESEVEYNGSNEKDYIKK